uniref:NADH-ubiquinone oxidoreductase chain 5 n=1 Tax=Allocricetulus eversmanni TaxID=329634 RepID=A0A0U1ZW26_9RODE|nr:NADH dehydrogenase subunit 5 [Allocricetulus eversmanni]
MNSITSTITLILLLLALPIMMTMSHSYKTTNFPAHVTSLIKLAFYLSLIPLCMLFHSNTELLITDWHWITINTIKLSVNLKFDFFCIVFLPVALYVTWSIMEFSSWYMHSDPNLARFIKVPANFPYYHNYPHLRQQPIPTVHRLSWRTNYVLPPNWLMMRSPGRQHSSPASHSLQSYWRYWLYPHHSLTLPKFKLMGIPTNLHNQQWKLTPHTSPPHCSHWEISTIRTSPMTPLRHSRAHSCVCPTPLQHYGSCSSLPPHSISPYNLQQYHSPNHNTLPRLYYHLIHSHLCPYPKWHQKNCSLLNIKPTSPNNSHPWNYSTLSCFPTYLHTRILQGYTIPVLSLNHSQLKRRTGYPKNMRAYTNLFPSLPHAWQSEALPYQGPHSSQASTLKILLLNLLTPVMQTPEPYYLHYYPHPKQLLTAYESSFSLLYSNHATPPLITLNENNPMLIKPIKRLALGSIFAGFIIANNIPISSIQIMTMPWYLKTTAIVVTILGLVIALELANLTYTLKLNYQTPYNSFSTSLGYFTLTLHRLLPTKYLTMSYNTALNTLDLVWLEESIPKTISTLNSQISKTMTNQKGLIKLYFLSLLISLLISFTIMVSFLE